LSVVVNRTILETIVSAPRVKVSTTPVEDLVQNAPSQKDNENCIDCKIARQVHREIEDERVRHVEHGACAFLLRPLHRYMFAAE
jgi:hypothetical protein